MPSSLGLVGLVDDGGDGVAGLRGGDEALGPGPEHGRLVALELVVGPRREQPLDDGLADQRGHAVVAQPAGVDRRRARRRGPASTSAAAASCWPCRRGRRRTGPRVIVGQLAGSTGMMSILAPWILSATNGKARPAKLRPAAGAADDHVHLLLAGLGQLLLGLQADDRLVQQHVVEHAAQAVAGLAGRVGDGGLDGLADGDAQASRACRASWPGCRGRPWSRVRGAGDARGAPGLHHQLAEGLLVEADAHHEDLALQADQRAGEGQGAAPLAGAGLGGQPLDAELLVVPGLRDGGVGLVAAGRARRPRSCSRCGPGVLRAFSSRRARYSGAGPPQRTAAPAPPRGCRSTAWWLTSCSMRFIGKTGASISGPDGLAVGPQRRQQRAWAGRPPGCTTGGESLFRPERTLSCPLSFPNKLTFNRLIKACR